MKKLKGSTKIELFEAGILVEDRDDNNVVTDFLNDILTEIFNTNYMIGLDTIKPALCQQNDTKIIDDVAMSPLIQGVALFEDTLNEATLDDYIFPPGNAVIGFAGGSYGGANPQRGTLNRGESGKIGNSFKVVFDFSTSQANGTFAAVALMPDGGAQALDLAAPAGAVKSIIASVISRDTDYISSGAYVDIAPIGTTACGYCTFICKLPALKMDVMCKFNLPTNVFICGELKRDMSSYNFLDDIRRKIIKPPLPQTTDYWNFDLASHYSGLVYDNYANKLYDVQISSSSPYQAYTIKELSMSDLSIVLNTYTGTLTEPATGLSTYAPFKCAINDGILIYSDRISPYSLHRHNVASNTGLGLLIDGADMPDPTGLRPTIIPIPGLKKAILGSAQSNTEQAKVVDLVTGDLSPMFVMMKTKATYQMPVFYGDSRILQISNCTSSSFKVALALNLFQLATKNNLAAPITKTSAQTMKITYTLSW